MMTDNSSFERVDGFTDLGTTLTNQNSIQEEIKNTVKSGNAGDHSVHNLLSSILLSKNLNYSVVSTEAARSEHAVFLLRTLHIRPKQHQTHVGKKGKPHSISQ
jgi:hypothetical protein